MKLTLDPITAGYRSVEKLNENSADIMDAIENTLSRDGTAPNYMLDVLDMNNERIINVGAPVGATDAIRKQDLDNAIFAGGGGSVDITQSVTNGDVLHAPSGDAVYDFVVTQVATKPDLASSVTNGDTTHAPSGDAVFDALALKADAAALSSGLATKAAASHVHSGSDITSGVLGIAQIPQLDASKIATGTIDSARLPATAGSVVASGDITTLTAPQQAQIVEGTTVYLSTGARYVYNGSGSKTDLASYTLVPDSAPDWSTIGSKPANVTALAGLTGASNKVPYFTGSGTMAVADYSATGRTLTAVADAAAALAVVTPLTTKGDLMGRSASVTTRLGVGTDGQLLKADSTAATGLAWTTLDVDDVNYQFDGSTPIIPISTLMRARLTVLQFIPTAYHAAIAARTSTVNVASYIQQALTAAGAAGGLEVYFEPGLYRVSGNLYVPSGVKVSGPWSAEIKVLAPWVATGSAASTAYSNCLFINSNWNASSLTDSSIELEGLTIDCTGQPGNAHCWLMRYVTNAQVRFSRFRNAGNATSMLATKDSLVIGCLAENMLNAFYDHWDGFDGAQVIGCTGRGAGAQGIQFTGTGGVGEARNSKGGLAANNRIYGVRAASEQASAIIFNTLGATSTLNYCKSIGNYVEDSDIGIVFSGVGGYHQSIGDTLNNVTKLPVFLKDEGSGGSRDPNNCTIDALTLINCAHLSGNVALFVVSGQGHTFRGIKIVGTTTYSYQLWLASTASGVYVHPIDGGSGTSGTILDHGSSNQLLSYSGGGSYLPLTGGTVSGAVSVVGTLTCGAASDIVLSGRQTAPGFYVGGDGADSLGGRFNNLCIALGNLGLIG